MVEPWSNASTVVSAGATAVVARVVVVVVVVFVDGAAPPLAFAAGAIASGAAAAMAGGGGDDDDAAVAFDMSASNISREGLRGLGTPVAYWAPPGRSREPPMALTTMMSSSMTLKMMNRSRVATIV